MEILGIGVPELTFIILIALILLGPKDMVAAGRTIGKTLRKFLTSPTWMALRRTGDELQKLPTKLVREAGLEDFQDDLQEISQQIRPPDFSKSFDEAQVFGSRGGAVFNGKAVNTKPGQVGRVNMDASNSHAENLQASQTPAHEDH